MIGGQVAGPVYAGRGGCAGLAPVTPAPMALDVDLWAVDQQAIVLDADTPAGADLIAVLQACGIEVLRGCGGCGPLEDPVILLQAAHRGQMPHAVRLAEAMQRFPQAQVWLVADTASPAGRVAPDGVVPEDVAQTLCALGFHLCPGKGG